MTIAIGTLIIIMLLITVELEGRASDRYIIKKNKHYAHLNFNRTKVLHLSNEIKYSVIFNETCIYDTYENQDINKLCGITDINSLPHTNSLRFGWKPNNASQIELFAYWYIDGVRGFKYIDTIELHETYFLKLSISECTYKFMLNNQILIINRNKRSMSQFGVHFKLFPYFGGDLKAPHDIRIHLKDL